MSAVPARPAGRAGQAELEAARLLLARLGVSAADLLCSAPPRPTAPTFAAYVPVVAAGVGEGTRRVYGSYWNRILAQWADRRLDEPTPSDVQRLVEHVRTHTVARRNARDGRSAAELTCCEPPGWSGPLGAPGDLLLVAVAAVRAAKADERTPKPTGSPTAQCLPADVTVRERGVGERAARLEALTHLLRTGLTTEAIAVRTGLSTRTLDRLRVAVDNPSP
jgi:hypothetical protein